MDDDEKLIAAFRQLHAELLALGGDQGRDTTNSRAADRLSALKAERDRMAAALRHLADDARWWKVPEVENQEYIADACMAMLRLMRAHARAALSQEPTASKDGTA